MHIFKRRTESNEAFIETLTKPIFSIFFMMSGQVKAFFGRQIRIPRQILPLYMSFYKIF